MSTSTTIIAALKYQGGVVIAADSQASDQTAGVRWPLEKLDRLGKHPLVLGFSGSVGMAQRARAELRQKTMHSNTFDKRERVRKAIESCLIPIYQQIKKQTHPPHASIPDIALWGLAALWAENAPQILEFEINGDSSFHDHFHAIGSASATAYAVYRTLGGKRLCDLASQRALPAMLRIVRTCVDVEVWGVSEPLSAWDVSEGRARRLSEDEMQAHLQVIHEWIKHERVFLFPSSP